MRGRYEALRGTIPRCAILTRPCLIHPYPAPFAQNAVQDPASAHPYPRQSANIQTGPVVVLVVVVPARCLQTQPSTVRRASDTALSKAVTQDAHSRKILCFRHSLNRSLSFECCRVPIGLPYSGQSGDFLSHFNAVAGTSHTAACSAYRTTGHRSSAGVDCPVLAGCGPSAQDSS